MELLGEKYSRRDVLARMAVFGLTSMVGGAGLGKGTGSAKGSQEVSITRNIGYWYGYGNFDFSDFGGGGGYNTAASGPTWKGTSATATGYPALYNSSGQSSPTIALQDIANLGANVHAAGGKFCLKPLIGDGTQNYDEGFFAAYLDQVLLPYLIPSVAEREYGVDLVDAVPDLVALETEFDAVLGPAYGSYWINIIETIRGLGYAGIITTSGDFVPDWYPYLDWIGGDFYPMIVASDPSTGVTVDDARKSWASVALQLRGYWENYGKPGYLGEVGWYPGRTVTDKELENVVSAMFQVLGPLRYWTGFNWWCGYTLPPSGSTNIDTGSGTAGVVPSPAVFRQYAAPYLSFPSSPPRYLEDSPPAVQVGAPYPDYSLKVSGTTASTLMVSSGGLPSGMALSSVGGLSGTPTAVGSYEFRVIATNSAGSTLSRSMRLAVVPSPSLVSIVQSAVVESGVSHAEVTASLRQAPTVGNVVMAVAAIRRATSTRRRSLSRGWHVEVPRGFNDRGPANPFRLYWRIVAEDDQGDTFSLPGSVGAAVLYEVSGASVVKPVRGFRVQVDEEAISAQTMQLGAPSVIGSLPVVMTMAMEDGVTSELPAGWVVDQTIDGPQGTLSSAHSAPITASIKVTAAVAYSRPTAASAAVVLVAPAQDQQHESDRRRIKGSAFVRAVRGT